MNEINNLVYKSDITSHVINYEKGAQTQSTIEKIKLPNLNGNITNIELKFSTRDGSNSTEGKIFLGIYRQSDNKFLGGSINSFVQVHHLGSYVNFKFDNIKIDEPFYLGVYNDNPNTLGGLRLALSMSSTSNVYVTAFGKEKDLAWTPFIKIHYETYINHTVDEYIKEQLELLSKNLLDTISNSLYSKFNEIKNLESITYNHLIGLINENKLKPGYYYRIIDYITTTSDEFTKSSENQFDIIIKALDTNKIDKKANAIQHLGNNYFNDCDLSKWELWYDIDNNKTKYSWADPEKGTGVIYRMIDEYGNDCPYDFKNIQFKRSWDSTKLSHSKIDNEGDLCFTFSSEDGETKGKTIFTDNSINSKNNVRNNKIKETRIDGILILSNNCFFGKNVFENELNYNCKNNTFKSDNSNNKLDHGCKNIVLKEYCFDNNFGSECKYICLGQNNTHNIFGKSCGLINLNSISQYNKFGELCQAIYPGTYFIGNEIGSHCSYIYFISTDDSLLINSDPWKGRPSVYSYINKLYYFKIDNGLNYLRITIPKNKISKDNIYQYIHIDKEINTKTDIDISQLSNKTNWISLK